MIVYQESARSRNYGVAVPFAVPATALRAALPVIGSHRLFITFLLSFLPVELFGGQGGLEAGVCNA